MIGIVHLRPKGKSLCVLQETIQASSSQLDNITILVYTAAISYTQRKQLCEHEHEHKRGRTRNQELATGLNK